MIERFETKATQKVANLLIHLRKTGGIMALTGPIGTGLSTSLEMATRQHPELRIWKVMPLSGYQPRAFAQEIAAALGIEPQRHHSTGECVRALLQELARNDFTLVLDECQRLSPRQLDLVAYLAEQSPRLVLAGSEAFGARLRGHEELWSQVRLPYRVPGVAVEEARQSYSAEFSAAWIEKVHHLVSDRGAGQARWADLVKVVSGARSLFGTTQSLGEAEAASAVDFFLERAA